MAMTLRRRDRRGGRPERVVLILRLHNIVANDLAARRLAPM
ncbi:hypothetical protein [Alloactinosynnema sp. L-07]|nr:hypothetical protein [Alloactinosynnema sp. L-07]